MPPHWFLTALPLLEVYCRSIALERELAEALGDLAVGSKEHDELARAWRAQASLIASLSTKLQLSPRSRHDRNIAPRIVPPGRKPWQVLVPQGDGDKPGDGTA